MMSAECSRGSGDERSDHQSKCREEGSIGGGSARRICLLARGCGGGLGFVDDRVDTRLGVALAEPRARADELRQIGFVGIWYVAVAQICREQSNGLGTRVRLTFI